MWGAAAASAVAAGILAGNGDGVRAALVAGASFLAAVGLRFGAGALLVFLFAAAALPLSSQAFGSVPLAVVVVALAAVYGFAGGARVRSIARLPLAVRVGATGLLAASVLSIVNGGFAEVGDQLRQLAYLVAGLVLVATIWRSASHRDVEKYLFAIAVGGIAASALTLLQVLSPQLAIPGVLQGGGSGVVLDVGGGLNRANGPIGDYELMAEYLATCLMVQVALLVFTRPRWALAPVAAGTVLTVLALIQTGTRSSAVIAAAGAAVIVGAAIIGRRGRGVTLTLAAALVAALLLPSIIATVQDQSLSGFLFERFSLGSGLESGLGARLPIWSSMLSRMSDPLGQILGSGPAFPYAAVGTFPHSLPITLLMTVGILGLASFVLFAGGVVAAMLRAIGSRRDSYSFVLAVVCATFLVNEVKIEFVRVPQYIVFVWGVFGLALAAGSTSIEEPPSGHPVIGRSARRASWSSAPARSRPGPGLPGNEREDPVSAAIRPLILAE